MDNKSINEGPDFNNPSLGSSNSLIKNHSSPYLSNESNVRASNKKQDLSSNSYALSSSNNNASHNGGGNNQPQQIYNSNQTSHNYLPPQLGFYNVPQQTQLHPTTQQVSILPTNQQQPRAGKTRMRVSKACDRCRTQKIKCSGTHPCDTCVKHKKDCSFSTSYSNQQPSHQNSIKKQKLDSPSYEPFGLPILNKSNNSTYVEHLENRIQYLENLLSNGSSTKFKKDLNKDPEVENIEKSIVNSSSKWRYSRRHQNALVVQLCKNMYDNLSEESKKKVNVPRTQYFGWNMSGCNYLSSENLPHLPEFELPMNTKVYIDYFFNEINPLFAILHETVFREQVIAYDNLVKEELTINKDVNDRDSKTNQTRLFSAKLYLIYALSIRFMEIQKPKNPIISLLEIEERLFKYSYKVVSILSFEWESFELIQSWLLISLYLRVTHRQTSSYHALGQAIIMTKSMGLGQNYAKLLVAAPYEQLKAKRIFWCVYTFDRLFGLQSGRHCGLNDADIVRPFPSLDFTNEVRKDDWLTLPAFALIHLARISNIVHTDTNDNADIIKYQRTDNELKIMNDWLNSNGFKNDSFFNNEPSDNISSLVKVQVKLHYYDLIVCIHGKILFNYVGKNISNQGLKINMVLDAFNGVIEVLDKTYKAGLLYTPWYLVLLLLFNAGISAITFIHGGVYVKEAKDILKNSIRLCLLLKKCPVRDENGKIIIKERFKMAKECLWAIKMSNHILSLRLQEDYKDLNTIGIDHGSSDVNKQMFTELGINNENEIENVSSSLDKPKDEYNALLESQSHRNDILSTPINRETGVDVTPTSTLSLSLDVMNNEQVEDHNLLGNLQWFDQWLNFNYDF